MKAAPTAPAVTIEATEKVPRAARATVPMVDMTAHNGLRGACALWVVLGHCLNSYVKMNASAIMPLFFMLSGFSLTAMYGRTDWALPSSPCCSSTNTSTNDIESTSIEEGKANNTMALLGPPAFAWRKFYRNRAARVLPIFYIAMLLAIPLFVLNLDSMRYSLRTFLPSVAVTTFPCATVLSFLGLDSKFKVMNGPGWFVCTLVWFWVAFPWWLPRAQRLTDQQLTSRITWCFYLQLIFMFGWYIFFEQAFGGGPPAFNTAGKNPISRFPLFLMGMYAGLLALRHPLAAASVSSSSSMAAPSAAAGETGLASNPPMEAIEGGGAPTAGGELVAAAEEVQETAKDEMPWPSCILGFPIPPLPCLARLSPAAPASQHEWALKASRDSAAILLLSVLIGVGESLYAAHNPAHAGFQAQLWWQAVVPMAQLNIIVALTRDGESSLASKVLRTPLSQYLGKISMTLYLVHMPLITYVSLMFNPKTIPVLLQCGGRELDSLDPAQQAACLNAIGEAHTAPLWSTVIVVLLSIALSEVLYRLVEVPARKALRAK